MATESDDSGCVRLVSADDPRAVAATEAGILRQEFPLAAAEGGNFESKTTAAAIERAVLSQV